MIDSRTAIMQKYPFFIVIFFPNCFVEEIWNKNVYIKGKTDVIQKRL